MDDEMMVLHLCGVDRQPAQRASQTDRSMNQTGSVGLVVSTSEPPIDNPIDWVATLLHHLLTCIRFRHRHRLPIWYCNPAPSSRRSRFDLRGQSHARSRSFSLACTYVRTTRATVLHAQNQEEIDHTDNNNRTRRGWGRPRPLHCLGVSVCASSTPLHRILARAMAPPAASTTPTRADNDPAGGVQGLAERLATTLLLQQQHTQPSSLAGPLLPRGHERRFAAALAAVDDAIVASGGPTGGWRAKEHGTFLRLWREFRRGKGEGEGEGEGRGEGTGGEEDPVARVTGNLRLLDRARVALRDRG